MIIWSGWGILTVAILGLAVPAGIGLHDIQKVRGPYGFASLIAAGGAANGFAGGALNRPLRAAGAGGIKRHSLFWMPMEWWSAVFLVLALLAIAQY